MPPLLPLLLGGNSNGSSNSQRGAAGVAPWEAQAGETAGIGDDDAAGGAAPQQEPPSKKGVTRCCDSSSFASAVGCSSAAAVVVVVRRLLLLLALLFISFLAAAAAGWPSLPPVPSPRRHCLLQPRPPFHCP